MTGLLVRNEVVLAAVESTYNVDATPTGADAIAFSNVSLANEGLRMNERDRVTNGLDTDQRIYGGTLRTITLTCELKGSGTAGTPPEFGVLLRGCSMDETIVASTSVTYAPVSTGQESLTIYHYEDGVLEVITGARGTATLNLSAGTIPSIEFTFTGHATNPIDASPGTPTFDATTPEPIINVPFTWGGYAAVVSEFTVGLNNVLSTSPSISAADGYGEVQVTGRDVGGQIDPESTLVANDPVIADFRAGNTEAVSLGTIGSTAGNRVAVSMPVAYYTDTQQGEREGIRTKVLPFSATASAGDDDISIVFT